MNKTFEYTLTDDIGVVRIDGVYPNGRLYGSVQPFATHDEKKGLLHYELSPGLYQVRHDNHKNNFYVYVHYQVIPDLETRIGMCKVSKKEVINILNKRGDKK